MRFLRFRKKSNSVEGLDSKQREILERELKESQESAMPSNTSSNMSDGNSLTTSKMFSAVNKRGLDFIIGRRVLEPRKNLRKPDQNS
ncbi:MAG: hypothetical protein RL193_78 [Actinomycetota bacterium]|jgi:hypothetical protein